MTLSTETTESRAETPFQRARDRADGKETQMGRWIESLKGLEVIVTGDFRKTTLGMRQSDVEHELRSRGAVVIADIRLTTDLLIRADSPLWKYGDYGDREAELARHRRDRSSDGVVVDVDGLVALLDGLAV